MRNFVQPAFYYENNVGTKKWKHPSEIIKGNKID